MDWFRMYGEFAADPKVQSMSEAMQRRLIMLFCLRCSNALVTLQDDEIAFALRISEEELAETKALFLRKKFIEEDWSIRQWDSRQYASDSSAVRVARHRERKKEAAKRDCNVTVSVQNRTDTEQNRTDTEEASATRVQPAPAVELSIAMRSAGIESQPADPRLIALAQQGVAPETVTAACEEAKRCKPGERIGPAYVIAIVERWAAEAAQLRATGATAPAARASPTRRQTAQDRAQALADRLTGKTRDHEPASHDIIDINARPAGAGC